MTEDQLHAESVPEPDPTPASPISRVGQSAEDRLKDIIALSEAAGRDVRMRIELRLLNPESGSHMFWPESAWTVEFPPNFAIGMAARQAVAAFVDALFKEPPEKVIERLTR